MCPLYMNEIYKTIKKNKSLKLCKPLFKPGWKDHLEISASALTSASASLLQKFYFAFGSFLWSKTSMVKSFSSTLAGLSSKF